MKKKGTTSITQFQNKFLSCQEEKGISYFPTTYFSRMKGVHAGYLLLWPQTMCRAISPQTSAEVWTWSNSVWIRLVYQTSHSTLVVQRVCLPLCLIVLRHTWSLKGKWILLLCAHSTQWQNGSNLKESSDTDSLNWQSARGANPKRHILSSRSYNLLL